MNKKVLLLCLTFGLALYGEQNDVLRKNKQNIIEYKKEQIEANKQKLKYNWVSPLSFNASYTRNSSSGSKFISDASLNFSQNVFRFGGIYYQMSYADAKSSYDLNALAIENAAMYKELFLGLLELKSLRLSLEQTEYNLKNSDIEIFLKTQQYKTGTIDITELNRALRDKNTILKTKLTLKQSIVDKEISLQKLSDTPIEKIQLPTFSSMSEDAYKRDNYNIRLSQLDIAQTDENYNIIKSNYYPVFSLNAAYGYMDNPNLNRRGDYNSVGVLLNIPLDFNTKSTIEESRITLLRKKLEIQETKRDEDALYKQGVSKIKNYKEHNKVVSDNITLYTKLIDITKEGVRLGMKTGYDLQTLQNTKKIDELEIKINETNIQTEMAKLRFATTLGEEYYGK